MGESSDDMSNWTVPGQFRYDNMILCPSYPSASLELTRNLPTLKTDLFMGSYIKAGNTLLGETAWLLMNDADVDALKATQIEYRVLFVNSVENVADRQFLELVKTAPHPRCFQTHFPFQYLPKTVLNGTTKCISCLRNPKDMIVSFYHFHRCAHIFGHFPGTWDEFFEYFKRNDYLLTFGNPIDHMLGYWQKRHKPNIHIVFYEDLVLNKERTVRKMNDFLETNLSNEKIAKIVEATSFEKMKESVPSTWYYTRLVDHGISPFMRKGKIGDWKNYFNEEQNRIMDEMIEKKLSGTGLEFFYG